MSLTSKIEMWKRYYIPDMRLSQYEYNILHLLFFLLQEHNIQGGLKVTKPKYLTFYFYYAVIIMSLHVGLYIEVCVVVIITFIQFHPQLWSVLFCACHFVQTLQSISFFYFSQFYHMNILSLTHTFLISAPSPTLRLSFMF